jgi:hypothetical protein
VPGDPREIHHSRGPNEVLHRNTAPFELGRWARDFGFVAKDAHRPAECRWTQGAGALGILDPSGKLVREIGVDAHPESFQLEKTGTCVFVNIPDKQEVQVADFVKGTILARWPTTTAKTCFPMALHEAHHRLFVGCRTPGRLLVFDTERGQTVASPEIIGIRMTSFTTRKEAGFT